MHRTKPSFYQGVAWYRKKFVLPNVPADKKVFIEFEGAMSTAEIWINGTDIGVHNNSGYTGFVFDISSQVNRTDTNVIAVKLDNSFQADVPPGNGTIDYITLAAYIAIRGSISLIRFTFRSGGR